jgi:sporulation protein YlmC with PRC-barrel domain
MKRHLFMSLLVAVLLFPSAAVLAQGQTDSRDEKNSAGTAEVNRIRAFRAKDIIGSRVINLEGQQIGTIANLVIDIDTGRILYAALDFGGFLGFRDKLFAVPWQSLAALPTEGLFILDQSKKTLQKAPGFDKNNWPDIGDQQWQADISRFYKRQVPFHRPHAVYRQYQAEEGHREHHPFYPDYATSPYPSLRWDPYSEIFDPETIATVTGKIVKIEYYEQIRLMLYTDAKKPVMVDLGPIGFLESQGKIMKRGDQVTVTGSMVIIDDTPIMVATTIQEGNEELHLRDNEGHPVWIGWKKIK